jgi:hypothetical protein
MLASHPHWAQNPASDHFGELRSYSGYEIQSLSHGGHENYYSQNSSSHNTSKLRSNKNMPSKSRRGSTVDGDYEWDEPEQDHKKKSRSKLPAEDKLVVSLQLPANCPTSLTLSSETSRSESRLTARLQTKEGEAHQRIRTQGRRARKPSRDRQP